jgi:hypothetical protein
VLIFIKGLVFSCDTNFHITSFLQAGQISRCLLTPNFSN